MDRHASFTRLVIAAAWFAAALAAAEFAAGLASASARAQATRTFVSGHGTDTGACGLPAPCRSFAYAIGQTVAGGDITVLDPAGYGPVTITKAISIINEGVGEAGITSTSGDGITIGAGAADIVNLRGLTLVGVGGANGITFNTGGTLNMQNDVIRGFANYGLNSTPSGSSALNVSDTIVSGNLGGGISLAPSGMGTTNTAYFKRTQAIGNGEAGFLANGNLASGGTITATAADCLAANNVYGVAVGSISGGPPTTFVVVRSQVVNNLVGLQSQQQNGTIVFADSQLSGNYNDGYAQGSGGAIDTFGNNKITDTTSMGTLTKVTAK